MNLDPNLIDIPTFQQTLEGDDYDFSKMVVLQFVDQADSTIPVMQALYTQGNLQELSRKAHYLKSSSAQLGIKRVREQCELIQHYANLEDFRNNHANLSREQAIELLTGTLQRLLSEYQVSKQYLLQLYSGSQPPQPQQQQPQYQVGSGFSFSQRAFQ